MKELKLLEAMTGQKVILEREKIRLILKESGRLPKNIASWLRTFATGEQKKSVYILNNWLGEKNHSFQDGRTVGKRPQTLVLDLKYQDGSVAVHADGSMEIRGQAIKSQQDFERIFNENFE